MLVSSKDGTIMKINHPITQCYYILLIYTVPGSSHVDGHVCFINDAIKLNNFFHEKLTN